ncbi:MAG: glutaredoxin family protein [Candidatus Micrarchaeota archaeon]
MAKKVVVYSSSFCPWCDKAKEFLKENNIEFEEKNVQENEDYAREMQKKTGQLGVPVIDVDGKIIIGFNVPALKAALDLE